MYDLNKIKSEINLLPSWDEQICLQGANGEADPYCGEKKLMNVQFVWEGF